MTIWADQEIHEKFKNKWYMYNATHKKKITQAEFLNKLLNNYSDDKEE